DSATKAKIQLSARPKALTSAMHARACATPAWKPNPMMYPTMIISTMIRTLRTRSAVVRPTSTADRAIGIERKRSITPSFRSSDRPTAFEPAGEHGLPVLHLRRHRGEGGESCRSEPALYPDRVEARRCGGHAAILEPDLVRGR